MKVEIVNTGTELLLGQVVNSHLAFFGARLFELDLRVERQVCVPDGEGIGEVLGESFARGAEVVLVTGGLGPTSDDVTREITAAMFGVSLELNEEVLAHIEERFRRRGRKMPADNSRQAMVPAGAEVLWNAHGTAPGLYFAPVEGRPHLFLLPGPPRELHPMFEDRVKPILENVLGGAERRECRNFKIMGVGESDLAAKLEPELSGIEGLELGYCTRYGEVDVRCIAPPDRLAEAEKVVRFLYGKELISTDGRSIAAAVLDLLEERGETIATAESCTGGKIAHLITNVPGASGMFLAGLATYANEAKTEFLGVAPELIVDHGAVSREVAEAMAEGCRQRTGATHAISATGIAGPGGGSEEKPVGTVFVGLASEGNAATAQRFCLPVERETFKSVVARTALDLLRRRLLGF